MIFSDFTQLVGRTPVVRYRPPEVLRARIWVKLEGFNPTGSVKDRACVYILKDAVARGYLAPVRRFLMHRAEIWLPPLLTLAHFSASQFA